MMGSRIFELYRRAAMGNGDTGTPVPPFIFQITEVVATGSNAIGSVPRGVIPKVTVKVQNIGNVGGTFRAAASGYYIDTTDLANDEEGTKVNINFTNTVDAYLESGGTIHTTVAGEEIGGRDRRGTLHVNVILTGLSFPYFRAAAEADGHWQGDISIGTQTTE
ncbi:hypothetical protein [Victivallis vadensis]|uniref:hypothetical protein n=1 Tax=Victivallis vadensis TaxID=172901 RepID=UPI00307D2A11